LNNNDITVGNKNLQQENQKSVESDFCTQSYAEKKVEAIYDFVKSPKNKLYLLFLNYTVHVFDDILKNLQTEEPMIHVLRKSLVRLLRNVMTRFVKSSAFAMAMTVDSVDYRITYNQKTDQELVIGDDARELIKNKATNHLRESRLKEFYLTVRKYFISCCDFMIAKLPLNDELLRHAEVADVACEQTSKVVSLLYFIDRFPKLLPKGVTKDELVEQFVSYQLQDIESCCKKRMDENMVIYRST
jgi:hypothetical protein